LGTETIKVKRPRVRNLEDRFVSRVLPLFERETPEVRDLLPKLYLHGLASGDFEMALRGLLGEEAPLSASSLQALKEKWEAEYERWRTTPIEEEMAYLWADGIYVRAAVGKEKAALLTVLGSIRDGTKRFLALEGGYRESKESWAEVLRQLKQRGLKTPRLFVGDGHLGLWAAMGEIFPEAEDQICWNHKILDVLEALPKKQHTKAKHYLSAMMYAGSRDQALGDRRRFGGLSPPSQGGRKRGGELGTAYSLL
jgi:transposase-like protein